MRKKRETYLNVDFPCNGRVKKDNMILESIRRKFGIETTWHYHYMALERVLPENRPDVMSMLQKRY